MASVSMSFWFTRNLDSGFHRFPARATDLGYKHLTSKLLDAQSFC